MLRSGVSHKSEIDLSRNQINRTHPKQSVKIVSLCHLYNLPLLESWWQRLASWSWIVCHISCYSLATHFSLCLSWHFSRCRANPVSNHCLWVIGTATINTRNLHTHTRGDNICIYTQSAPRRDTSGIPI